MEFRNTALVRTLLQSEFSPNNHCCPNTILIRIVTCLLLPGVFLLILINKIRIDLKI